MGTPDTLMIILNTSIPGYQQIKYVPNMTFPDTKEKTVLFNPYIKLNKSIIEKVPESLRIKQFFNKGLFDSLINFHGIQSNLKFDPSMNNIAIKSIIDNNIQITLQILFPVRGILYINKQPYSVADIQYTNKKWIVDKKSKYILKSEIGNTPKTFFSKQYDEKANKEYNNIPYNLRYGTNVDPEQEDIPQPKNIIQNTVVIPIATPLPLATNENKNINDMTEEPILPISKNNSITMKQFFISGSGKSSVAYQIENTLYKNLEKSAQDSVNKILRNTTGINTGQNNNNLSEVAYNKTVNGLRIIKSNPNGDCLFDAVAQALNNHNYRSNGINKQMDKIIINNIGNGNKLFTTQILRNLLSDKIIELKKTNLSLFQQYLLTTSIDIENLNNQFRKNIEDTLKLINNERLIDTKEVITIEEYINDLPIGEYKNIVDTIYKTNPNFFVKKPTSNFNILLEPFKEQIDKNNDREIKNFIESTDYWGDEIAINILSKIFHIIIITIERKTLEYWNKQKIKNKEEYKTDDKKNALTLFLSDCKIKQNDIQNINAERYMFLYRDNNHFELVTFSYNKTNSQIDNERVAIFKINSELKPPFYIIFLIFASYYLQIKYDEEKSNVYLFKKEFDELQVSFNKIKSNLLNPDNNDIDKYNNIILPFFNKLYIFFGYSNDIIQRRVINEKEGIPIYGGAEPNVITGNYPYDNNNNPYNNNNNLYNNNLYNNNLYNNNLYNNNNNPYYNNNNPYYNNPYNNNYNSSFRKGNRYQDYYNYNLNKNMLEVEDSSLTYKVNVDMELQYGKTITNQEISNIKCRSKWNSVRKAYSDFRGLKYIIPPVYNGGSITRKNIYNKNNKNKTKKVLCM